MSTETPPTAAALPSSPTAGEDVTDEPEAPSTNADPSMDTTGSPEQAPDNDDSQLEEEETGDATKEDAVHDEEESSSSQPPPPPPPPPQVETEAPSVVLTSKSPPGKGIRVSKRIKIRRKSRPTPKIYNDVISVIIPLTVTADLKVAIQRTRNKRIQSIYKRFPALKKAVKKWKNRHDADDDDNDGDNSSKADDPMDEDDEAGNKDPNAESSKGDGKENNKPSKSKKKKILAHVPQPEQYGSVLDYLEAKYVRGVQLGDEEADGESMEDGSEGHGSVYSGGSFLDDGDLQRDVAEQVMANTTLTKLELEDDDGEFFVNVGALEVEDNQYGENYDPLQDKDAAKVTKKRKKSQVSAATEVNKSLIKKKKKTKDEDTLAQSSKSKKSVTSTGTQKQKSANKPKIAGATASTTKSKKEEDSDEKKALKAEAKKVKSKTDALFKKLAVIVKKMSKEDLPRRKTKLMVSLTCPANKKAGDDVTFTNPHNKGQRLRAKIPKNCSPGGAFKVSVPIKHDPAEDEDGKDHNNLSRDFQELLDDYARAYDSWCTAQSAVVKNFALLKEKQAKYDSLIELFPKNLLTPVTVEYMKKIVRRARQNRHKRRKTAELKPEDEVKDDDEEAGEESEKEEEEKEPEPNKRIVEIPTMGSVFPKMQWKESDFVNS